MRRHAKNIDVYQDGLVIDGQEFPFFIEDSVMVHQSSNDVLKIGLSIFSEKITFFDYPAMVPEAAKSAKSRSRSQNTW